MAETKDCPYCAEQIRTQATRCPHCRSRLEGMDHEQWYRDHPQARLAGVCTAVAGALGVSTGAVRLGFVVASFVHLTGVVAYGFLWLAIPEHQGEDSVLERILRRCLDAASRLGGKPASSDIPTAGGAC